MITTFIALVTLAIGLALGFYGRMLLDRIQYMYDLWQEKNDRHEAGVVTPRVSRVTRNQPIDLSSETGGVMRPRPDTNAMNNIKAREERIRERSPVR